MEVTTESGRPATMARCATCGTELLSVGGHESALAQVAFTRTGLAQPVVIESMTISGAGEAVSAETVNLRLTDIRGIGEARARQLADIGIDTVEKLAAATPTSVARIKFITTKMAPQLVDQAKAFTATGSS